MSDQDKQTNACKNVEDLINTIKNKKEEFIELKSLGKREKS